MVKRCDLACQLLNDVIMVIMVGRAAGGDLAARHKPVNVLWMLLLWLQRLCLWVMT